MCRESVRVSRHELEDELVKRVGAETGRYWVKAYEAAHPEEEEPLGVSERARLPVVGTWSWGVSSPQKPRPSSPASIGECSVRVHSRARWSPRNPGWVTSWGCATAADVPVVTGIDPLGVSTVGVAGRSRRPRGGGGLSWRRWWSRAATGQRRPVRVPAEPWGEQLAWWGPPVVYEGCGAGSDAPAAGWWPASRVGPGTARPGRQPNGLHRDRARG